MLAKIIEPYVGRTGGLISALRAVQAEVGYLPEETEAVAGDLFNITRAEVKGVISFYHDFTREPKGETVVRLCAAEACQAAGGRQFVSEVEKQYALKMGETSASKDITLEPVYCLGLCSCAPAAMVGGRLVGMASAAKVEKAIERVKRERVS
ncbi:NAD(P)H-dependent oxidoreductase subunit E [Hyphococcus flavus]|uniref:NAD(P)H-dependent oxidoreductase subunit E n=1 Tax=Hyphococcus flavus TaxID=1866326 RepID=A0AAF0CFG0_9PROT|nr:NAD(P)H-dependent oxidoreductase subunit E [Hyphococcus flavus]WDI31349.1 NAD(P)H-dependent oxidoreductase subunit E [Hyphococcus flavus]